MKQPPKRPAPPRRGLMDDDDDDEKTLIFDRAAHGLPPLEKAREGDALFPLEEIEAWEHTMMMDDAPVRALREAHQQRERERAGEQQPLGVPRPPKSSRSEHAPLSVRSQNKQAFDAIAQHISQPTPPPPAQQSNRRRSERPPAQPLSSLSQTRSAFPPPPHQSAHPPGPRMHSQPPPAAGTHPLAHPLHRSPAPPPVMSPMPPHASMTPPPGAVSQHPPSPFARSSVPTGSGLSMRPGASIVPPHARAGAAVTTSRGRPPPIAGLILFAAPMAVAMLLLLALAFS